MIERVHVEGFGTLLKRGNKWSIRYAANGRRCEESTGSDNVEVARKRLRERIEALGRNERVDPSSANRVKMSELLDGVAVDYQVNRRKSIDTLRFRLDPLREHFGQLKAVDVN